MKLVVKHADFAIYVTQKFLQERYPCVNRSVGVSNVVIKNVSEDVLNRRLDKIKNMDVRKISLMTTAGVDLHSKGQEYVVKAMRLLKDKGITCTYYLAGDGDKSYLMNFAKQVGVDNQLVFLGRLSLDRVFENIDEIDIYIQPSLQEGLPRALIEALSRSCPSLGARTAGIPELLDSECIFERKSPQSIATTIENIIKNNMEKYAKRNYIEGQKYLEYKLNRRRNEYFDYVEGSLNNTLVTKGCENIYDDE